MWLIVVNSMPHGAYMKTQGQVWNPEYKAWKPRRKALSGDKSEWKIRKTNSLPLDCAWMRPKSTWVLRVVRLKLLVRLPPKHTDMRLESTWVVLRARYDPQGMVFATRAGLSATRGRLVPPKWAWERPKSSYTTGAGFRCDCAMKCNFVG
jgi:hypothetical protein